LKLSKSDVGVTWPSLTLWHDANYLPPAGFWVTTPHVPS